MITMYTTIIAFDLNHLFLKYKIQMKQTQRLIDTPAITLTSSILFVGGLLSESNVLRYLAAGFDYSGVAPVLLIIMGIETLVLLFMMFRYAVKLDINYGFSLQIYELVLFPTSIFVLLVIEKEMDSTFTVISIFLLAVQSVLLIGKNFFLRTVCKSFRMVSNTVRVLRVAKIAFVSLFPWLQIGDIFFIILVSTYLLVFLLLFVIRLTFRALQLEYTLLIILYVSIVSQFQYAFATSTDYSYNYLAEISSVVFFMAPQLSFLLPLFNAKIRAILTRVGENRDYLSLLILIEEVYCKASPVVSKEIKFQALYQFCVLENYFSEDRNQMKSMKILVSNNEMENLKLLYKLKQKYLNQNKEFSSIEYLILSGLEISKQHKIKSLIYYYQKIEKQDSMRALSQIKYRILYEQAVHEIHKKQHHALQSQQIQFSSILISLWENILDCLQEQLKLMECLSLKKYDIEDRVLNIYSYKNKVRGLVQRASLMSMYLTSIEFKYLFLIFELYVEKNIDQSKREIKKLFFSPESKEKFEKLYHKNNNIIVVGGFSYGDIIANDQEFDKKFGIISDSFAKNNIGELIPTQKQRYNHISLMLQSEKNIAQKKINHQDLDCYLLIEGSIDFKTKIKMVEIFNINTRIYYQHRKGFNYICILKEKQKNENVFFFLERQFHKLQKTSIQFKLHRRITVEQLQQKFQLFEVYLDIEVFVENDKKIEEQTERIQLENHHYYEYQEKIEDIQKQMSYKKKNPKSLLYYLLFIGQIVFLISVFGFIIIEGQNQMNKTSRLLYLFEINEKNTNKGVQSERNLLLKHSIDRIKQKLNISDQSCSNQFITNLTTYLQYEQEKQVKNIRNFHDNANQYIENNNQIYRTFTEDSIFLSNLKDNMPFQKHILFLVYQSFEEENFFNDDFIRAQIPKHFQNSSRIDNFRSSHHQIFDQLSKMFQKNNQIELGLTLLFLILVFLMNCIGHMLRSYSIASYVEILFSIPRSLKKQRLNEIKSLLKQFQKKESSKYQGFDIDENYILTIKKENTQKILFLEDFCKKQCSNNLYHENDDSFTDEIERLLKDNDVENQEQNTSLSFVKTYFANKILFGLYVVLLVSLIACLIFSFNIKSKENTKILQFHNALEEVYSIKNLYQNLILYDWLRMDYEVNNFNKTQMDLLYNQTLKSFSTLDYHNQMYKAFPNDFANSLQYSSLCKLIDNTDASCAEFNNGFLNQSGLNALLPVTVKSHIENSQVSIANASYYQSLACESMFLLSSILNNYYNYVLEEGNKVIFVDLEKKIFLMKLIIISLYFLVVILVLYEIIEYFGKNEKYHQQALSIDSIRKLYDVDEYKPHFNRYYYEG